MMKKIYLTLLGTIIALGANAQFETIFYNREWLPDSIVCFSDTGERYYVDVYEYNSDGTIAVIYTDTWHDSEFFDGQVYERSKMVFTYNSNQNVTTDYFYQEDSEWTLYSRSEYSDFNADGLPGTVINYEVDDDDPGQLLPDVKIVVTKYAGKMPADYEYYQPDFGSWDLYSRTVADINDKGLITKQTCTTFGVGTEYVSTTEYEYDDHGKTTKETEKTEYSTTVSTYENTYDANGNIYSIVEYCDGVYDSTTYYYWRGGNKTAIRSAKMKDNNKPWFDLGGRQFTTAPTKKGIFIQNGKKVINK